MRDTIIAFASASLLPSKICTYGQKDRCPVSFEQELLEQRRAKLEKIKSLGFAAYPHQFAFSHTLEQVADAFSSKTAEELAQEKPSVRVCGRLQAIRGHGKAGFADLTQGGHRLQV